MPFSEELKQYRGKEELTQREMGQLLGISQRMYAYYESGEFDQSPVKISKYRPGELVFDGLGTWEGAVKALRAWATEAGIDKKITWHTARHSLGYRYINEHGGDISILKAILGHKDIKTTQRYAALSEETKRDAMDRL